MNDLPIPRDIPLPMPTHPLRLQALLILAFIAHILFVNLMLGGSLMVFGLQLRGLRKPDYDKLAHELAFTVTVNKSMAVVLGVAPLLVISVLYTMHFYTANALTGSAWILLVPGIATTFLLLYLHKYTWERLANLRGLHIAILGLACVLLLIIPLVFLANVNLMLFPERWTSVVGLLGALSLPNVLPRYLHFLSASLIVTSLFSVYYFGRPAFAFEGRFESLTRAQVQRVFYAVAFVVSLAQFIVGPLVLFTLPGRGLSGAMVTSILTGAVFAVPAVWMIWRQLRAAEPTLARFVQIVQMLGVTVVLMAIGRHLYRETALAEHRVAMQAATLAWQQASDAARQEAAAHPQPKAAATGEALFRTSCSACHGATQRVVGPPLTEIARLYADNPGGIVTWARAPGKKRADFPQMPSFAQLGDDTLSLIAAYMIERGSKPEP